MPQTDTNMKKYYFTVTNMALKQKRGTIHIPIFVTQLLAVSYKKPCNQ